MPKFAPAPRIAQNRSAFSAVVGAHDRAVGEHDLGRAQVVDGQPVLAGEPADAARGGEPADADAAVVAGAQRPAVRRERGGHVASSGRRARSAPAGSLVEHLDRVQPRQVDDDAAVVGGPAADAVPAAAHRQRHVLRPGERERRSTTSAALRGLQHQARVRRRACRSSAPARSRRRPARRRSASDAGSAS